MNIVGLEQLGRRWGWDGPGAQNCDGPLLRSLYPGGGDGVPSRPADPVGICLSPVRSSIDGESVIRNTETCLADLLKRYVDSAHRGDCYIVAWDTPFGR